MIVLVLALSAVLARAPALSPHKPAVVTCVLNGGTNNRGLEIQTCVPDMKLLRSPSGQTETTVVSSDGAYLHEFVFEAAHPMSWEATICSPALIDFNLAGLSGLQIVMSKLQQKTPGCVTKQFTNVSGTFSLVVRTRSLNVELRIRSVFGPFTAPIALLAPNAAPDIIPVEIPFVPAEVFMPPTVVSIPVEQGVALPGALPDIGMTPVLTH